MTRRPGLTMTEVLVALFVMALGTIAILTMFPLGMLNMAQALKDDRTSQAAVAADGYMRWYWKTFVAENQADPFLSGASDLFDNPGGGLPPLSGGSGASYPVVVDPIGAFTRGSGTGVTQVGATSLPRVNLTQQIGSSSQALRTCTLLDGFTYDQNGLPDLSGGSVQRDTRYNWLWVLQRPVNQTTTTATMTVVVFDRRAPGYVPPNAEASLGVVGDNVASDGNVTQGATGITVTVPGGVIVAKGTWIMDATLNGAVSNGQPMRNAYFYRVVSATPNGANVDLELETPIRTSNNFSGRYTPTLLVFAGVADVFARPSLTAGQ